MYTFFSIVFGLLWAAASFMLLFKVWDAIGPMILGLTKSHAVQVAAMILVWLIIFGIPAWLWTAIFG